MLYFFRISGLRFFFVLCMSPTESQNYMFWVASVPPIYRSLEALRAENREKVSKKSSWPFRPRVSKKSRKGRKVPEKSPKVSFRGLFDLFGTFLRLWAGRPRKTFLRLFRGFRPGGPRDSCRWAARTQVLGSFLMGAKRKNKIPQKTPNPFFFFVCFAPKRKGRAWTIAVRTGLYKSLFLPNLKRREVQF